MVNCDFINNESVFLLLVQLRMCVNLQCQFVNDFGGYFLDKIMLVSGELDVVVVVLVVDIEWMVVFKVQGFGEWYFKYCGDFVLVGVVVQIWGNNVYYWCYLKVGDVVYWWQDVDYFDCFWWDCYFFLSFVQGGGDKCCVGIIYCVVGKGDLVGVFVQQW